MGIYIKLNARDFFSSRDHSRGRVRLANEVWRAFEGWFAPQRIEVWRKAPQTQLDGTLVKEIPIHISDTRVEVMERVEKYTASVSWEELLLSIIMIKGVWRFDSIYNGYIAINNNYYWRQTYLDIEVDGYMQRENQDFVDFIINHPDMGEEFIKSFTKEVAAFKEDAVKLSAIYFFKGPVSTSEIFMAKALYYPRVTYLVSDMLASFKAQLREKRDTRTLSHLRPYDSSFIISKMMESPQFMKDFPAVLEETKILEIPAGSVLLIGKKSDSFQEAFNLMSEKMFRPIARRLHDSKYIGKMVDEALSGYNERLDAED